MKTQATETPNTLPSLSTDELAEISGGAPVQYTQADADAMKRKLDRTFGRSLNDPGRAVARRVPGTDKFTVETPRLNDRGLRRTIMEGGDLNIV